MKLDIIIFRHHASPLFLVFFDILVKRLLSDLVDRLSNVLHIAGSEPSNRYSAVPSAVDGVLFTLN